MQFVDFSQHLSQLETTSSRLEMTSILADLYQHLKGEEIEQASYLLEGQLVPQYLSLEFQLSVKMIIRALARIQSQQTGKVAESITLFGESDSSQVESDVQKQYKKLGDVGLLAQEILSDNSTSSLNIHEVYEQLVVIAQENGEGSQERKLQRLVTLLEELDSLSAKYVVRIIVGRLRLGFSTMTMLDALSWAKTGSKQETAQLEEAFQRKADLGKLARTYLETTSEQQRLSALENYQTEEGVPIVPQLCQRLNDPEEVIEKMGEVIAEPKYDGLRVQIHMDASKTGSKPEIRAFTRNLENVSHMFPELAQLPELINAKSVILDAEAIGYDPTSGKLLLFQATMTRKRKHNIEETAQTIPLKFFVFDVIAVDGQSLINKELRERKDLLSSLFKQNEVFQPTEFIVTSDPKELQTYHEDQLGVGLEGVVIKQVVAPYQSGRKNWYWVKMKEKTGTRGKLNDTLDCVVMGYYFGRGKRTVFGIGAFLVGILDTENTFKTIAKIGTGLSDEQFKDLKIRADQLTSDSQPAEYDVRKELFPDIWIKPEIVVEVAADELTISPLHSAGYALRFPRLVRFRDDKSWKQATTLEEVQTMLVPETE